MKNNLSIIDNQYFGCFNYYSMLIKRSNIEIEQFENWEKMSFRNRCIVAGSNGLIHLSVPIENGREQKGLYKDIRINNRENWQQQHWRTLFSCYGKSPFFEYYRFWLEDFFTNRKFQFLFDMNLEVMKWVIKMLKFNSSFQLTEAYRINTGTDFIDYRNKWKPKNFQQGENNVQYFQLFSERIGFQPNLSILDLLFCEGPNSIHILMQQNE